MVGHPSSVHQMLKALLESPYLQHLLMLGEAALDQGATHTSIML